MRYEISLDLGEKMKTLLLCVTVMLAATSCQSSRSSLCGCLKTSLTILPVSRIKAYSIQKASPCHIEAVMFTTIKGIKVCSDPKKLWVKKAMKSLNAVKRTAITTYPTTLSFNTTWKSI
ncbi:chemokine (C-X-C motif) ligand 32b, duplicate 1 [Electrophorus electricus]|uniref:Chemokine interleukin-8-like domain-containing protein n=1 Tax=Electrophorus electricus TaxID=8005 RepID=A0A4W4ESD2_ELEEL|nr:chemokine (C-X-C motif) ligand 32b, duplicate 1 [Electrophorus electricus]